MKIKIGDIVMIKKENEAIVIRPVREDVVGKTFGLWGKSKEAGWKIVKKIRKEDEGRLKRLGL
jgi:bifunctional DNA-binding transcriptional regulator/antitoxin component of YhaV-PrlF toxin-antitoxin module